MSNEPTIKIKDIIKNARKALRSGNFPNHNAFTISEIVGAVTCLPKEYIIEEMLKKEE